LHLTCQLDYLYPNNIVAWPDLLVGQVGTVPGVKSRAAPKFILAEFLDQLSVYAIGAQRGHKTATVHFIINCSEILLPRSIRNKHLRYNGNPFIQNRKWICLGVFISRGGVSYR